MAKSNFLSKLKSQPQGALKNGLTVASPLLVVTLLCVRAIFPELIWLTIGVGVLTLASLGGLLYFNKKALQTRQAAHGVNSAVTVVLVLGIIGVLNFLSSRYPLKWDLTQNKVHTLSEQTTKLIKTLRKPVKGLYFAKPGQREAFKSTLDNYKALNTQFDFELIDPDREPTRAREAGVKKYNTLQLKVGTRENLIEDPTEEKLTNALMKLTKDKSIVLCAVTGHGEKSFASNAADGLEMAKKSLSDQSYEIKDVNLIQEGKVPATCDALAAVGASKPLLAPEVKILADYLAEGGRMVVALDLALKGPDSASEWVGILAPWFVKPVQALVVDPVSRIFGVDASVSLIAPNGYSKSHGVTKDFQANSFFPFLRPIEALPSPPAGMTVEVLAKTTPNSFGVSNLKALASGQINPREAGNKPGPLGAAVAVEGKLKDSKATKSTRLVVFGSSHFATNNYSRMGGNQDFFLNAISWTLEDESLISIRAKEDGAGRVELSQRAGTFIFLLTVILIPLAVAVAGVVIWIFRRRL